MLGNFHWFTRGDRATFLPDPIPRGDWSASEVRRAMSDPRVRDYLVWSRFPFVRTERTAEETAVFFGDARFTNGPSSGALQGIRIVLGR